MKVEMKNISIEFPGVKALENVDFTIEGGKTHALIGANGAGKSTLMKVLAGANGHYSGNIYINGENVEIRSPKDAKNLGIEIVYQEVDTALIPYLSVAENIMFNYMVNDMDKKQIVNWKFIRKEAKKVLEKLNVDINVNRKANQLTLAQKQMVLIARAVVEKGKVLVLDEPTAPLSNSETQELFRIVNELKDEGVAIVFISHRLNELFEICGEITVLRNGKFIKHMDITDSLEINDIVELMLGHPVTNEYKRKVVNIGENVLDVENLTEKYNKVKDINMHIKSGEIVAIAGLVGAGKTELCKTLFGHYRATSGKVKLKGKEINNKIPTDAVKNGLALVPEERRSEGVLITDSVYQNITIASMEKYTKFLSYVDVKKEKKDAVNLADRLGVVTPSINQPVALLSGGNQQKVAIAKWLNSDSEVYIFDEPTKGIDVGAKEDMYLLIEELAELGKGILYATSEYQEILTLADRVYVMFDGKIVKELEVKDTTEKELLYYSTGGN